MLKCLVGVLASLNVAHVKPNAVHFKVELATVVHWSGGIAGTGGNRYSITLSWPGNSPGFSTDSVWVNDHKLAIHFTYVKQEGASARQQHLFYFDESYNRGVFNYVEKVEKPPVAFKGVALIRYTTGKKARYIRVPKYTSEEIISLP